MNRQEFLKELKQRLETQPHEMVGEVLADFSGMFDEGLHGGKTEEQICRELGDPAEIAERIKEEADLFVPAAPAAATAPGGDLNISLYSMNLSCTPYDGSEFQVTVTQSGSPVWDEDLVADQQNGGLELHQPRPDSVVSRIFQVFDHSKTVHVSVPRTFQGNVSIRMTHGNMICDSLAAKRVWAKVISGNVRCNHLAWGEAEIDCVSGNIRLDGCNGPVVATGKSGNIHVNAHTGSVSASTISGNNHVETDCISVPSKIQAKSGNIKVKVDELKADLTLRGVSGGINLTVEHLAANVDAKTTSGNIKAYFPADVNAVFSNMSSQFKSDFPNARPERMAVPVVSLHTRSGVVRVKQL